MPQKRDHISAVTLLGFLGDSLPVEKAQEICEHLLSCSECLELAQGLSALFAPLLAHAEESGRIHVTREDLLGFFADEGGSQKRTRIIAALAQGGEKLISQVSAEESRAHRARSLARLLKELIHSCRLDIFDLPNTVLEVLDIQQWRWIGEMELFQGFGPLLPKSVARASAEDSVATLEVPFEGEDFVVRFAQLGNKGVLSVSTCRKDLADGLVLLELLEGDQLRYRCVLMLEGGKAEQEFPSSEWESIRPLAKGLTVRVKALASLDALQQWQTEASVSFLRKLVDHEKPEIRKQAVGILSLIRTPTSDSLLERLSEDESGEVRHLARAVRDLRGGNE